MKSARKLRSCRHRLEYAVLMVRHWQEQIRRRELELARLEKEPDAGAEWRKLKGRKDRVGDEAIRRAERLLR